MRSPNMRVSSSALGRPIEGARNSGLDGRQRPSRIKDGEIGRRNRKLRQGSMVVYAERTGDHRHILARNLPLGQIGTDRAVRFVANPFLIGKRLRERADLRSAARRLARSRCVLNAEKPVQARSGNRYCRHDSGEEPSHDRIGQTITQGKEEKRSFRQDLYLHNYSLSTDCPRQSRQTRENQAEDHCRSLLPRETNVPRVLENTEFSRRPRTLVLFGKKGLLDRHTHRLR